MRRFVPLCESSRKRASQAQANSPGHRSKQPTTLQERIARLNLPSTSSSAPAPTPAAGSRTTGATGKIGDKIARFQQGTNGEAPLIPTGSFGLGGVRRDPSSGAGGEKGRVASLGGGRAAVPLDVVKGTTRSASPSSTAGRDGASEMRRGGSASSRGSSVDGSNPLVAPTTPSPEPSPPSTPAFLSSLTRADSISSIDQAGSRTPASISSMNVETGSLKSDSGADPAGLSTPIATSPVSSPLSSPIVDAMLMPENPVAITLDSSPDPPFLRGPVASLKAPRRTASTLSVSSMVVEHGSEASEGVGNLEEVRTPTGLEGKTFETETFPSTVGAEEGTGLGLDVEMEEDEDAEKAKEAATKAELERYEREVEDATKPLVVEEVVEAPSDPVEEPAKEVVEEAAKEAIEQPAKEVVEEENETPVLLAAPLEAAVPVDTIQLGLSASAASDDENHDSEGGYGDFLDEFADEDDSAAGLGPSGMPLVKCSDCSQEVDLLELADHTCAPKSPSPAAPTTTTFSPPRPIPDVPQDDEEEEDELADPDIGRRPSSRPLSRIAVAAVADSPREPTPRQLSLSHSTSSLDAFVPQTESLIPDDVLDDYGDEAPDSPIAPPSFRSSFPIPAARPISSDVPEDLDDDEVEELSSATPMTRSASGRRLPGVDDSDEEGYEGGSVTIVRQTLSHRTTGSR